MAERLDVRLHPLVILNISDHYVRRNADNAAGGQRVIGALFGVQTGRTVEIFNSFEITIADVKSGGVVEIRDDFLKADTDLYKKVYPDHEYLGWYSTGEKIEEADSILHKKFTEYNESPLFLMLNPTLTTYAKELPIKIYESEVHMVKEVAKLEFVDVGFTVTTEEAERITADHVVKVVDADVNRSAVTPRFIGLREAILSLKQRLDVLRRYLTDVKSGKVPTDQAILREIRTVCNRLPTMDSSKFKHDFLSEYNDALLVTYLATMTKGAEEINKLVDKFAVAYERPHRGGGREF